MDEFKLTGSTLKSVHKEVDIEEESIYAELYRELEETDRRISRTRSRRGTAGGKGILVGTHGVTAIRLRGPDRGIHDVDRAAEVTSLMYMRMRPWWSFESPSMIVMATFLARVTSYLPRRQMRRRMLLQITLPPIMSRMMIASLSLPR